MGSRGVFRHLFIACTIATMACVSARPARTALLPQPPQQLLARARVELKALGYTPDDVGSLPEEPAGRDEMLGGEVWAQRALGPDMETRGFLYEVILVTASPEPSSGQTRITVRGGTEALGSLGIRQRVPSRKQVREDVEVLLRKLIEQKNDRRDS
jgi:hypothetical protein